MERRLTGATGVHYACVAACLVALGLAAPARADVYYVRADGNDANTGTADASTGAWLTIAHAESVAAAGDIVRVQPGMYEERVEIDVSGRADAWVTFIADGAAVCRGFDLTGVSYVRVIGFEITHVDATFNRGLTIGGVSSHVEIIDNYIHDVNGTGIHAQTDSSPTYVTVRGNTIYFVGHGGTTYDVSSAGISNFWRQSSHWLVEYNTIERAGDFIITFGPNMIVRNNFLHDFANAIWFDPTTPFHSDMFQPGSDGVMTGTQDQVYERNFTGDSIELDSHFGIWQDTVGAGDHDILIRGNVAYALGAGGIGVIGTDGVVTYENTFHRINQMGDGATGIWYGRTDPATRGLFANTIIDDDGMGRDAIIVETADGNEAMATNNLGHLAGTEASYVTTEDPQFVDATARDFHLQAGSPAIDRGAVLVHVTSASGSGTTFAVDNPHYLNDGWGMTEGDVITVGGTTTNIVTIAGSNVTTVDSVTWTMGAPVLWGSDATPDIGAFPFGSTELTAAILETIGTEYTVTPTGDARGVWFYVDGIPTIWDSHAPYSATIASGAVTAKAYARYASRTPVIVATPSTCAPGGCGPSCEVCMGGLVCRAGACRDVSLDDAGVGTDAGAMLADSGTRPGADAASAPPTESGGCDCRAAPGTTRASWWVAALSAIVVRSARRARRLAARSRV